MDEKLLGDTIRNCIESSDGPVVSFVWHGGEPTLAGLDFYRKAVELQRKYLPAGWQCWNNLQSNGLLLDENWCRFLADNHFDVGISIDGTKRIHDFYRKDSQGKATYEKIKENIQRLKEHGVKADLLCTVTEESAEAALEVYECLSEMNTGWIQFIPIVNRTETGYSEESVKPESYGRFLCALFDEWIRKRIGETDIQLFMEMMNIYAGGQSSLCWLSETCGMIPVIESDGTVYSCDHFVNEANIIGHIAEDSLRKMLAGKHQYDFSYAKKFDVAEDCLNCPWWHVCHGACPKDRVAGRYYLCDGLKMLFKHSEPYLKRAVRLLKQGYNYRMIKDLL